MDRWHGARFDYWYRHGNMNIEHVRPEDVIWLWETPAGAIVADVSITSFCAVWFDDVTRTAVFEPVATVPAQQRRGLATVVMLEGLRRIQRIGATRAYVSSSSAEAGALYASIGFTHYDLLKL